MKRKAFEHWEHAFVLLARPYFTVACIASHLNRTHGSVEIFIYRNRIPSGIEIKIVKSDDVFGRLTVISEEVTKRPVNARSRQYLCRCSCGNVVHYVRKDCLLNGNTQSCGCSRSIASRYISGSLYSRIRKGAYNRGKEFRISLEYIDNLYGKQNGICALSGTKLYAAKASEFPTLNTASLDRIDSSRGYVEGNVQWVHKDINRMKSFFSREYFTKLCAMVYCQSKGQK
jgi:hypothetical protein